MARFTKDLIIIFRSGSIAHMVHNGLLPKATDLQMIVRSFVYLATDSYYFSCLTFVPFVVIGTISFFLKAALSIFFAFSIHLDSHVY